MSPAYLALYLHIVMLFSVAFVHYRALNRSLLSLDLRDACAGLLLAGCFLLGAFSPLASTAGLLLIILARFQSRLGGYQQGIVTGLLALWCLVLATHQIPGFARPSLLHNVIISAGQGPFSLSLGLDKAFVGAILFIYLMPSGRPGTGSWLWTALLSAAAMILLAVVLGIRFDVKVGSYLLWFIPVNLLITCLAEEMFFRKIVQDNMNKLFGPHIFGAILAVLVTGYLFILAHGIVYPASSVAILYAAASLLYALVYQYSKRVELAILTHFMVNLAHILLLPYPLYP